MSITSLRPALWRHAFSTATFIRGKKYAEQNKSRLLQVNGCKIQACCDGSQEIPYQQTIQLELNDQQQFDVDGRCTCPVSYNCKHIVSALLAAHKAYGEIKLTEASLTQKVSGRPTAVLHLGSAQRLVFDNRSNKVREQWQHRAALRFSYEGHLVPLRAQQNWQEYHNQTQAINFQRDTAAEQHLRQQLLNLGFKVALRRSEALPEEAGEPFELASERLWLQFTHQHLNELRAQGWQIHQQENFYFNLRQIQQWHIRLNEDPSHQWFDLEMGIEVDGQNISLLPILLQCIKQTPALLKTDFLFQKQDNDALIVNLPNQQRLALPYGRIRPLLQTLANLYAEHGSADNDKLRLSHADAIKLNEFDQRSGIIWHGDLHLRQLAQDLQNLTQHEVQVPDDLQADLRPYQLQGFYWLQNLMRLGMGGVLADDMGLGKTLQLLTHILSEKQQGKLRLPALIVVPTSLLSNWRKETARFTPSLRLLILHGQERAQAYNQLAEQDIVVTTYSLLSRDQAILEAQAWHLIVLDEAQNIKNPRSKGALALRDFTAKQRIALTGTPIENNLGELWSLFNFVQPHWLGDQKTFNQQYRFPIENNADEERLQHLTGRLKPFILRRTKEQVAPELLGKTEHIIRVELTDLQRDRYETLRLAMDKKVRAEIQNMGLARSHITILEALLRLRQVCCDLRLVDPETTASFADSAKLQALLKLVVRLRKERRQILIFSQFTQMLSLIEQVLAAQGINYTQLTGSTVDRTTPVELFQSGQVPVFLISLKAGGVGLNLTAADAVIHIDPWWNPAAENQASDRAYRIGQDKAVDIYKLIARGSVEEKIQQLQQRKAALSQSVLVQGASNKATLDAQDIENLLAPLHEPNQPTTKAI
ncbi:DEAD/DEAH box helicase [Pseudomonas sp. F1_0610]|uniref:DEAD/DEAH box helicase n=1 Tax=Pseudomonas sp. F1_0610 TaxID=3114284 RepID=UPI0039C20CB9